MMSASVRCLTRGRRILQSRYSNHCFHQYHNVRWLSACIVGSGPSGMYTAKYLLKRVKDIDISIIDELPTPFGLVRFGVAPDHADTKNVINDFTDNVLKDERVSFFGNVQLGQTISIQSLQNMFDAVVLAYGASSDRRLGIPGEDLRGVFSARQFVNWYNGHPHFVSQFSDDDFRRNTSGNVVIIGQGNVAIDCARILASVSDTSSPCRLSCTDIATHALQTLQRNRAHIRNVFIVGRRGAVQSSFTNKELREVVSGMSEHCVATVDRHEMTQSVASSASQTEMEQRAVKRKMSIFDRATFEDDDVKHDGDGEERTRIHFRFLLSPKEFTGDDDGRVKALRFERNELVGAADEQKVGGLNEFAEIEAGLVLTSIGYRSERIVGEDMRSYWDTAKHVLQHRNGKVNDTGLYGCGWLKRGPTGIIGTNISDAQQTVNAIVSDYEQLKFADSNNVDVMRGSERLVQCLQKQQLEFVDKNGWFRIDEYEKELGAKHGKTREKMVDVPQMVNVANN